MKAVCLPDQLQRARSDSGLQHDPPLLAEPVGDILPDQPVVLNHQDPSDRSKGKFVMSLLPRNVSVERPWKPIVHLGQEDFAADRQAPCAAANTQGNQALKRLLD